VVRAAGLTPAQLPAARALQRKYAPVKGRLAEALLAAAMRTRGEAPESPAYDAAEALRIAAYADALASGRRAAREVFGDLLTRDQILAWVLGPTG
jgi:hypothetical protein